MEYLKLLFGEGEQLTTWQMSARMAVLFFVALVMLRIAGVRTFGRKSAFDTVIKIMLGAVMSRAVVGASPFGPVVAASLTLVVICRIVAWCCACNPVIEKWVKGNETVLFEKGKENIRQMKDALISPEDLKEGLRLQIKSESLETVQKVLLERNGEISVIEKRS